MIKLKFNGNTEQVDGKPVKVGVVFGRWGRIEPGDQIIATDFEARNIIDARDGRFTAVADGAVATGEAERNLVLLELRQMTRPALEARATELGVRNVVGSDSQTLISEIQAAMNRDKLVVDDEPTDEPTPEPATVVPTPPPAAPVAAKPVKAAGKPKVTSV